jgi:hypothetical protein
MARRPHRMTPRRRAALRRAQIASARKRRRGGSTAQKKAHRRKIARRTAIVAGGVVVGGVAAYQINYHARYITGYHRTGYAQAANIVKTRQWRSETETRNVQRVEGTGTGIWFATRRFGAHNRNFGPAIVKVKYIPRKATTKHRVVMADHYTRNGMDPRRAKVVARLGRQGGSVRTWRMVDSSTLNGMKVKQVRNPMPKAWRTITKRGLEATMPPHMQYLADNWADPPTGLRRR